MSDQSGTLPVDRNTHVFDGVMIAKETAAFQLCDITDPMLKSLIEDPTDLREMCHVRVK
jgi:general transcription factor 3C polypeptide 5 (transcription factor C subunit 1)